MAASPLLIVGLVLVVAPQALALTGSCSTPNVPKCDDTCSALGFCLPDSTWTLAMDCPTGQVCFNNDTSALCGAANGTSCSGGGSGTTLPNITCLATGSFPDLNDCTLYYNCDALFGNGTAVQCTSGTYFDSCTRTCVTGTCTPATNNAVCGGTVLEGVDPRNNALHYSCAKGFPRQYWNACPAGQQYSLVDKRCYPLAGCVGCTATGSLSFTGNACQYVWCYGRANFTVKSCTSGFHYDSTSRTCARGGC